MTTRLSTLFTALALAAAAAACAPLVKTADDALSPSQRHPITVDSDTASMTLMVDSKTRRLTPQMEAEVKAFAASYQMRGHGPLTVAAPVGSANAANATRVARDVERVAKEAGLTDDQLVSQGYNVSADETTPPVILSFTRYVASTAPCGDWSKNFGTSSRNTSMPDFGCSTQNNLAAMVEDPHDLVEPRPMDAADAERRAVVFDKYRKGESSATPRTEDEKANVSEVAK
jgi:pilus assembly protein CpaD